MQRDQTNFIGKKFGRLTIISEASNNANNERCMFCQCECGKTKTVSLSNLKRGDSVSCGCYRLDQLKKAVTKHSLSKCPEYAVFIAMRQRCQNPKCKAYKNYGARGIKCLWKSFNQFIKAMGRRPSATHSIGRIDNNGHYCKKNCEWQSRIQQGCNKRTNLKVLFRGEQIIIRELSRRVNIPVSTLRYRIVDLHWDVEKAVNKPVIKPTILEYKGLKLTLKQWSKKVGLPAYIIRCRIDGNWTTKDALFTKIDMRFSHKRLGN